MVSNGLGYLFMCLLAIVGSSNEKCLFISFFHGYIRLFLLFLFNWKSSLYFVDTRHLSDISFAAIFFGRVSCVFISLLVSVEE